MARYNEAVTSSTNYKVGIDLTVVDNPNDPKQCIVTVQPQLCYVGSSSVYDRKQHAWSVHFHVDNKYATGKHYHGQNGDNANYLPNNTAIPNDPGPGVVSAGKLPMTKGCWYNWGDPYTVSIAKDGQLHTFGVYMNCIGTQPTHCPAPNIDGTTRYLEATHLFPRYSVQPPTPTGLFTSYNKDTRELSYNWETNLEGSWSYIKLYRTFYDTSGNPIPAISGYISIKNKADHTFGTKIYNVDMPVTEVVPENVGSIEWTLTNYSSSEDAVQSEQQSVTIESDEKVWIKVNSECIKSIPWAKVDGEWKKADKTYVKTDDGWKHTIT